MGSISRIQGPVWIEGHESFVLAHPTVEDQQAGWSVTERPYRPDPGDLLRDACTDQMTCLLAGNRIHMADGSLKRIELVQAGEMVVTMSGVKRVEKAEETTLGLTRRVLELRGLGDQALFLSSDHPVWVSRRDKSGEPREWWGTYNIHHVLYEMHCGIGLEFNELPFVLHIDLPEQVAHESGWLHVRPRFHDLPSETKLFHLIVADGFSYFAEGFAVLSHCRDHQGPSAPWTGLRASGEAASDWRRLLAGVN